MRNPLVPTTAFGLRREHAPRTVAVSEEKHSDRAFRSQHLHPYIASLIQASTAVLGYAYRCRKNWRKPFLHQQTQGAFCGNHPFLLQRASRCQARAILHSALRSLEHKESDSFARYVPAGSYDHEHSSHRPNLLANFKFRALPFVLPSALQHTAIAGRRCHQSLMTAGGLKWKATYRCSRR
jgi:hypothetical protein